MGQFAGQDNQPDRSCHQGNVGFPFREPGVAPICIAGAPKARSFLQSMADIMAHERKNAINQAASRLAQILILATLLVSLYTALLLWLKRRWRGDVPGFKR